MFGTGIGAGVAGTLLGMPYWLRNPWDGSALLAADFANDRYFYDGAEMPKSSWLSKTGGVADGPRVTFGPCIAPDTAELLANGDFSGGASGWTAQNGGLLTITAGEAVLDGNSGTSPSFYAAVATASGAAYRLSGTYRRGSGASGCGLIASAATTLLGAVSSVNNSALTPVGGYADFGGEAAQMFVGGRIFGSAVVGTGIFDNISVKPISPLPKFGAGGFSARLKARTGAATPSAEEVLFQADQNAVQNGDNSARNRVRLAWGTDRHLRLVVNFGGGTSASLDLGVVTPATDVDVAFSVATNEFRAAIVGQPVLLDLSGAAPGIAAIRVGRSAAGEIWSGDIKRMTLYAAPKTEAGFEALAGGNNSVVAWGDSLTGGAGVSAPEYRYPAAAGRLFSPPRNVYNAGIGGQTSTEIAARQGGLPIRLTLDGNQIPASGAVAVTARSVEASSGTGPITAQGPQSFTGALAGIRGTLSRDAGGNYSFSRGEPGLAAACPAGSLFIMDIDPALRGRIAWFLTGRNGPSTGRDTETDLAAMIAHLDHDRYLVGSILISASDSPGAIATLQLKNASRASTYGTRYVDLMAALQAATDGSAGDADDVAAGCVPRSKRSDTLHLNDAGYAIVAAAFQAATVARGW